MSIKGKKYFLANWKMYLDEEKTSELVNFIIKKKDLSKELFLGIFPSSLYFSDIKKLLDGYQVHLGVQNGFWAEKGGYTGELSMSMLKKADCEMVLVGHSERRHIFEETDEEVNKKMLSAVENGLIPVLCIGETAGERAELKTEGVIEKQLRTALNDLDVKNGQDIFVAYEPVWAIGTGVDCSVKDAEGIHKMINNICREILPKANFIFLYGGSINSNNILDHLADPNVDGVLVGSASTKESELGLILEKINGSFS